MTDDLRRTNDRRIVELDKKVVQLDAKVSDIREMLISEAEASPLGRSLTRRADMNASGIADLNRRVNDLESWHDQAKGAYSATRVIQVLLAILVAILTLYNLAQALG